MCVRVFVRLARSCEFNSHSHGCICIARNSNEERKQIRSPFMTLKRRNREVAILKERLQERARDVKEEEVQSEREAKVDIERESNKVRKKEKVTSQNSLIPHYPGRGRAPNI